MLWYPHDITLTDVKSDVRSANWLYDSCPILEIPYPLIESASYSTSHNDLVPVGSIARKRGHVCPHDTATARHKPSCTVSQSGTRCQSWSLTNLITAKRWILSLLGSALV